MKLIGIVAIFLGAALPAIAGSRNDVSKDDVDRLAGEAGMSAEAFVEFAMACEHCRAAALSEMAEMVAEARQSGERELASKIESHRRSVSARKAAAFPTLRVNATLVDDAFNGRQLLRTGDVGALPGGAVAVLQITGDKSLLGFIYDVDRDRGLVAVEGVATAGVTDTVTRWAGVDHYTKLACWECFRVSGTKTYPTRAGSRTVFVLRRVDPSPIAEYLRLAYGKKKR